MHRVPDGLDDTFQDFLSTNIQPARDVTFYHVPQRGEQNSEQQLLFYHKLESVTLRPK